MRTPVIRYGGALLALVVSSASVAQAPREAMHALAAPAGASSAGYESAAAPFRSRADSLAWARARSEAHGAPGLRLVVSVRDRTFRWMDGPRVLREGPVAVGKGTRLVHGDRTWSFDTPRGVRRVIHKEQDPVWIPPDWHYVELARDSLLQLAHLQRGAASSLPDGGRLEIWEDRVVHLRPDGSVELIPADEEIVFGRTLFVPPIGTANRRVAGELGRFKLEIGDGYMLHGTPDQSSIGKPATHGCIRLTDADIEYLFHHVPVGTPVHLY